MPAPTPAADSQAAASNSPGHGGKLRVGVFADSALQPRWLAESLARVAALDIAEVIVLAEGGAKRPPPPWSWRAYHWVDTRLFGERPDPSEPVDLKTRVPHPRLLALPEADADHTVGAAWRAELAALRLDVAFALGGVDDRLLDGVARYGTWRYSFGEEWEVHDTTTGFREVSEGKPVTASGLRVRLAAGDDRLVYRSWSRTSPYSLARSRGQFLRKTGTFASRALRELHRSGSAWLGRCAPVARVQPVPHESRSGNADLVRGLSGLGRRIARRGLQRLLYADQWFIAYRFGGGDFWRGDLRSFARLVPPKDRYWADPFPLWRGGRHYIFFEELVFAAGKAHIAMVEVAPDGTCSTPVRVLERGYHLSYPFLIEHDGELFMVPETGANRTVEIYRCVGFPDRWRLEKVLLRDEWFVDATLHRTGELWWMFVNVGVEPGVADDELHLYYAEHLLGEWTPHRANPVKSDVRCSRPAGRLFERDGALFRPAQVCTPLYGSGVSINRVRLLSREAYLEQEQERVLPPYPDRLLGVHTLNQAGGLCVVDAFTRRPRVGRAHAGQAPGTFRRVAKPEIATAVAHTESEHR